MNEDRDALQALADARAAIISDLSADYRDLESKLSAKQKEQLLTVAIMVLALILNILNVDLPVIPTV